ncbi:MAG: hypothetical protein KAJ97_02530 [Acidobacteria bacterium]|nr:hypothetical protein [Acidobacteriota bacterium]
MRSARRLFGFALSRARILARDPMNFLPLVCMEVWWRRRNKSQLQAQREWYPADEGRQ